MSTKTHTAQSWMSWLHHPIPQTAYIYYKKMALVLSYSKYANACLSRLSNNVHLHITTANAWIVKYLFVLFCRYIEYLKRIVKTANNLNHLSLGFLPSLTLYNNEIVKCLAQQQCSNIKSLHLRLALSTLSQNASHIIVKYHYPSAK